MKEGLDTKDIAALALFAGLESKHVPYFIYQFEYNKALVDRGRMKDSYTMAFLRLGKNLPILSRMYKTRNNKVLEADQNIEHWHSRIAAELNTIHPQTSTERIDLLIAEEAAEDLTARTELLKKAPDYYRFSLKLHPIHWIQEWRQRLNSKAPVTESIYNTLLKTIT